MMAARLDALNLAVCRPSDWKRWQPGTDARLAESLAGFVNNAGLPAAFLFTFALPSDAKADTKTASDYATGRALSVLSAQGVVQGSAEELKAKLKPCNKVSAGEIAQGTAVAGNGLVHVVLLLQDAMAGVSACDVMNSVTLMQTIAR
jgi:hypothetical protein